MKDAVSQLKEIQNDWRKQWGPLIRPKLSGAHILFHYTDAKGLLGILEEKRIRATHFLYLNDSSEMTYAGSLANAILDEMISHEKHIDGISYLNNCRALLPRFEENFECYVACFSERSDLLDQWRTYGGVGGMGGYALGFSSKDIAGLTEKWKGLTCLKVIYDDEIQRKLLRDVFRKTRDYVVEATTRGVSLDDPVIGECTEAALREFNILSLCFKHPAFHLENEWRILSLTGAKETIDRVEFCIGRYGVTPYINIDFLADSEESKIPLKKVVFGPTSNPINARHGLELLLKKGDYAEDLIEGVDLPVRFR